MPKRKRCPICENGVDAESTTAPFCSERCKLIDLGKWLSEGYRIPDDAAPTPDDDDQGRDA